MIRYFMIISFLLCSFTQIFSSDDILDIGKQKLIKDEIVLNSFRHITLSETSFTIERYLIGIHNHPSRGQMSAEKLHQIQMLQFEKIINRLPLEVNVNGFINDFWTLPLYAPLSEEYNYKDIFLGKYNEHPNLKFSEYDTLQNNPRTQQRILNARELLRIKNIIRLNPNMINHSNFLYDDIIRALSLSGTFCLLNEKILPDKKVLLLSPIFSGMLYQQQDYRNTKFIIHTCLHGFKDGWINKIFFVPYGLNRDLKNSFSVQSVWRKEKANNSSLLIEVDEDFKEKLGANYENRLPDYALACISGTSYEGNNSLVTVLFKRQYRNIFTGKETNSEKDTIDLFPGFFRNKSRLPGFILDDLSDKVGKEKFSELQSQLNDNKDILSYYCGLGHPFDSRFALNATGFAIAFSLDDKINLQPLISLNDDPNATIPQEIATTDRIGLSLPSSKGMSGGPVFKVFLKKSINKTFRIGFLMGTYYGAERCFNKEKKLVNIMTFVNTQ